MRTIQVPGYGPVKFPESMSDEEIALAIEEDILPNIKPPKEGVGAAFTGGLKGLASRLQTAGEAIFSPEEAAQRGLARSEEIGRQYAPGASLEAVKQAYAERGLLGGAGEVVSQIPTALAEQLRSSVQALAIPHPDSPFEVVTVSAGVAFHQTGGDSNMLIAAADKALYTAKNNGRNCVHIQR